MKLRPHVAILVLLGSCSSGASPAVGGSGGASTAGVSGGGPAAGVRENASAGVPGVPASGSAGVPATFDTFKTVINEAPCFGAGCHNDAQNPLSLRVDDQLYARLTSHIVQNCGGLPVVNPGKPQGSALIKLLNGPCGATPRMPLGCVEDQDSTCIPADYIAAITQWIALGAPQQ